MEYTVVYNFIIDGYVFYNNWKLFLVAFLLIIAALIFYIKYSNNDQEDIISYTINGVMTIIILIGFTGSLLFSIFSHVIHRKKIITKINSGKYIHIEGIVKDVVIKTTKVEEQQLKVNNTKFLLDTSQCSGGYNTPSQIGGKIKEGQYVKINYIPYEDDFKTIIFLAIKITK